MRRFAMLSMLSLLGGCDFGAKQAAEAKHLEMERTMLELEQRIRRLEAENEAIRLELSRTQSAAAPVPADRGATCTQVGTGFAITQAHVDALFADSGQTLAREARVVPFFESGAAKGFKLYAIRPGGFFYSCGFKNGDVVKSVNGHTLTSPDKALEAYGKLKGSRSAAFEIERAGSPFILTIDVQG